MHIAHIVSKHIHIPQAIQCFSLDIIQRLCQKSRKQVMNVLAILNLQIKAR